MRFAVLGSGSAGNAALLDCDGTRILIDAGLSAKQLRLRLEILGIDPASVDGILLTHEHGDHVSGLKRFVAQYGTPVYASAATAVLFRRDGYEALSWKTFESGQSFRLGGLDVTSFAVQHDATDPVGFVIENGKRRFGYASDVGYATGSMTRALSGLHGLFIEANYDEDLLSADKKRPWPVKQRIASRHGHMSNTQVADFLTEIAHADLTRVVLGHLSSDCNKPELVLNVLGSVLKEIGHGHIDLYCACQREPSPWFAL